MKKTLVVLAHLFLSCFGAVEFCLSRSMRRLQFTVGYHYSSLADYRHPACRDISIAAVMNPHRPLMTTYLLCESRESGRPLCIPFTLSLN